MRKFLILCAALACPAFPQSTVSIRAGGPPITYIVAPGCSGTPISCFVLDITGLTVGDPVVVGGVADSSALHISSANGLRKIKTITPGSGTTGTIALTDRSNVDIAATGTWSDGTGQFSSPGIQYLGKTQDFTTVAGRKGWFDGDNGDITREWSLSTSNGLTSLIVASNVATVTVSYDLTASRLPLAAGMKVSIWNTTNATLSPVNTGGEYTVATVPTIHTFTFATSGVSDSDYTSNPHCGPGATPNGTRQGTDNCVVISQMAVSTSPGWVGILSFVPGWLTGNTYKFYWDGGLLFNVSTQLQAEYSFFGLVFMVDQKRDDVLAALKYLIDNVDKIGGNNFVANESANDGGSTALAADPNVPFIEDFMIGYQAIRLYLSTGPTGGRQTFIDKMANDISDPTPCTRNLPLPIALGSGLATGGSSTTVVIDPADSRGSSFYVNNTIDLVLEDGSHSSAVVTAYNSSTKTVTAALSNGGPVLFNAGTHVGLLYDNSGTQLASVTFTGETTGGWQTMNFGSPVTIAANTTYIAAVFSPTGYVRDLNFFTTVGVDNGVLHALSSPSSGGNGMFAHGASPTFPNGAISWNFWVDVIFTAGSPPPTNASIWSNATVPAGLWVDDPGGITVGVKFKSDVGGTITGIRFYKSHGVSYNIWESSSALDSTHLTGYNTHWNTAGADHLSVGDYLLSKNTWGFEDPGIEGFYVTGVTDDTHLVGITTGNGGSPTSTPATNWISHPWATGNCGFDWVQKHWIGTPGSQPIQYGSRGGGTGNTTFSATGANNDYPLSADLTTLWIGLADDDLSGRMATKLASSTASLIDNEIAFGMVNWTGLTSDGTNYGIGTTSTGGHRTAWVLSKQLVGFPALDTAGPWIMAIQGVEQYMLHPDAPFAGGGHTKYFASFGANGGGLGANANTSPITINHGIAFNPTSLSSKYEKYFLDNVLGFNSAGALGNTGIAEWAVKIHPASPSLNYNVQPLQRLFQATSRATAVSVFGSTFPATWHHDAFVSRTGWNSTSDTHIMCQARSYIVPDHDQDEPGVCQIYKAGFLRANNAADVGDGGDPDIRNQELMEFGGANTLISGGFPNVGVATIARYAGDDANNRYAYALMDLGGAYSPAPTRLHRHVAHFKKPGTEEVFIEYTDVAVSSAIELRDQLMFPQNLEAAGFDLPYNEGDTSCPGAGGCGSLDTNGRTVLEQEDGSTANGDPPHIYNLIYKGFVPTGATATWNWDGSGYAGAPTPSHAYRVSIYGGGSVGGTATSLEHVDVFKVATQPDATLSATALNPDANWTGAQTADKVALFSRGGVTHSSLAVTTSHSGTAQYILAGVTAGTATVTMNGSSVTGSPFAVDSNGVIAFESTAGALSLNGATGGIVLPAAIKPGAAIRPGAAIH